MRPPRRVTPAGGTRGAAPALALALFLAPAPPAGAQTPSAEPAAAGFGAETTVLAVEVPVRVLRDGRPVRGLTAENFVVLDEGEEREITSFEVLDLEEATTEGVQRPTVDVPAAARRHFLLLFDLDFTDGTYLKRAHEAARELVDGGLEATDLVAVAFFSNRAGVSSVLGFTPDRSQVAAALDQLGRYLGKDPGPAPGSGRGGGDPLGLTVGGWEAVRGDLSAAVERERSLAGEAQGWIGGGTGGGAAGGNRTRPDLLAETLSEMADYAEEDLRQKRAARASAMTASLRDLAHQYRWIDGQKYLVMFSQGFESDLYLEQGGSWLLRELREMLEDFRKTGWSIYSIEGVDLNTESARRRRESLAFLARETGGTLVGGRNDLAVSMARVLTQTSVTYLVGFQAPDLPADGSFRRLRVELRGVPRGTRVSHRAGYFVPRPYGELEEAEKRARSAALILSGRELDELGAAVFAGPLELTGSGGRIPLVLEIDRRILLAGPADRPAGVEIHVYALDPMGEVAAVLAQRVAVDAEKLADAETAPEGLKFFAEMDLPPGRYELRSLARSLRTGWVTLRRQEVDVPDAGSRALVPPVFIQGPAERWLLVRKPSQDPGAGERGYPFVFEGTEFLPAVEGSVAPGGEARLVVMGFGLGGEQVALESRALNRAGEVVDGLTLSYLARADGDGRHPDQIVLALQPEGVAPGEYVLELTLSEPGGERIGSVRAPVRVLPP